MHVSCTQLSRIKIIPIYLDANKTAGEEARRQLHKNVESSIE